MRTLIVLLAAALVGGLGAGCTKQAKKDRFLKTADAALAAGKYDEAEIEYKNALKLEPLNARGIGQLGTIYYDQGRSLRALSYLSKAAELEPTNFDIKAKLGMMYLASGKVKEARETAVVMLEKTPQNPEGPLLLAESSVLPKDIEDARDRLKRLPATVSESAPVLVALAHLDLRQLKIDTAEALLQRALKADPKSAAAHSAMGFVQLTKKDLAKVETELKAAAELSPLRSNRRLKYAQFKAQNKDVAEARRLLDDLSKQCPDYLPAWMALADIEEKEGKNDEALRCVAKVLSRESSHPDAMLLSGRIRMAKKEYEKAVAEMERMASIFTQVPQVHYQLGQAHLLSGNSNKALASFNQAVTLAPNFAEAIVAQATLNLRRGEIASSIVALKKVIQLRPDILQARLLLGDAYRSQDKLDDALAVYADIDKAFPRLPQTQLLSGVILMRQKKFPAARQALNRAVELAPTFVAAVEQLIALDFMEKNPDAARTRAEALIAKNPKSADAYILLSRVMLELKDQHLAEMALQKAIAVEPESTRAYQLLARLHLSNKEPAKALQNLQSILEKNPKQADALMLISAIHQQQNNHNAARDSYEKLLIVNPKFAAAYNNLAYLYSEHFDQLDRGLDLAQKARQLLPHDPNTADTLGWILYKKRQYAPALVLLEESAEKIPASADVQFHLGMTNYMLGEEAAARTALKKAIELDAAFSGHAEARRRLAILEIDITKPGVDARDTLEKMAGERKDDPIVLGRLAALYERERSYDKALATYEAVLATSPNNVAALLGQIRMTSARKDNAKALELAKNARKLAPTDPDVAHVLGRLASQSGSHSWGLSLLQEAARKNPDRPEVLFDTAVAAFVVGKTAEAETAMRKALEIDRGFAHATEARRFLDMVSVASEPSAAAATAKVETALKAAPNDAAALMASAAIQESKRDAAGARKTYEKLLGSYPDLVTAKKRLAILYASATDADPKKALELATKAREAYPEDSELAKAFGVILYRQNNYSRAASLLKESTTKREKDAEGFYYLGMARHKLKERTEAKKALQQALDLSLAVDLAGEARKVLAELK